MLGVQGTRSATSPELTLNYSVNGVLEVILANGTPIRTPNAPGTVIPPGTYEVIVNNDVPDTRDVFHMFHLSGPGVNLMTDLLAGDNKTELYSETLQPSSTYTFQDDRQPGPRTRRVQHVRRRLEQQLGLERRLVRSGGASGSSSTGKSSNSGIVGSSIKPPAFRGALDGTVSSAGKLTLTRNGKGVSNLKSGRYKITVDDRTSKSGFTVQEIRKQPVTLTGVAFVGKHTVTVDLKAGQWMFYSPSGKKNYFVVIT